MKTGKISNRFLRDFLIIFLFVIFNTFLAFALLSVASGFIANSLAKNQYPASQIIKEDYRDIDTAEVTKRGGGVAVVDKDYRVVLSDGLEVFDKEQLTAEEFTKFLTDSKKKPYHYDILYQSDGEFWLIVTFPTSVRLDFSLIYNQEASAGDFASAWGAITVVLLVYILILALSAFVYSRITAASITVPLKKLCDGTRMLREGDYSARVDLRLKNEFAELQDTFNDMASRIEQEITLRKKAEEDRRRLILDISHDLKNPMFGIQGYAELLISKPDLTDAERGEYLKVILNSSKRASLLLTELFELSQMDSPQFSLKLEKTDICEYIRQACGELVPQFERAGFEYEFDIFEGSVFVMLDKDRFSRVIQNLADNAIRYNPKGTKVRLSLFEKEGMVAIDFCDDGVGIASELAENIFKPFVRAEKVPNSKTIGHGLGLSIAKKIAASHGGDLVLLPAEKGSAFRITIPKI